MPVFEYQARRSTGEPLDGTILADDEAEARELLRAKGLQPDQVYPRGHRPAPEQVAAHAVVARPLRRIGSHERLLFWRQAAQAMTAGLGLARTFGLLAGNRGALGRFAAEVAPTVGSGTPLTVQLQERPDLFTPLELGLVRAGEVSGRLDLTLAKLAEHYERDLALRQRLRGPLAYLGCVGTQFLITAFVVLVVAPLLATRGSGEGASLAARAWAFGLPLLAVGGAIWLVRAVHAGSPAVRAGVDRLKLGLPLLGGLTRTLCLARYTQVLGRLVEAGLPLGEACEVAAGASGNLHLSDRLRQVARAVRADQPLSVALQATGWLPPQAIQMVITGEEVGSTDQMLLKLSEYYEGEAAAGILRTATVGTVLGFLVLALAVGLFAIRFFAGLYGEALQLAE
ncbi:MAG: type II secretion system F family protein [Fimbriimonadaceae bacterium]|nr:type II secretion system F family protein [Fimbriimonadaceae bacterium]